jgi:uncharacterized protein (TIGR01777 family)
VRQRFSSSLARPAREAFDWHARPGAIERLTPPWEKLRVVRREGTIHDGDRTVFRLRFGVIWSAVHRGFRDGVQFEDVQESGPFRAWHHVHRVEPEGAGARLTDEIDYQLPAPIGTRTVRRMLRRMFVYRHRVIGEDLKRHAATAPMKVAITGASGLVGRALSAFLSTGGHTVVPVKLRGSVDASLLDGCDAVVNLAGENIGARWTRERKQRIRESRIDGTRLLSEALARMSRKPRVLVSGSAVGIYGDRPFDQPLDESATPGEGFLAEVCRDWEAAAEPARAAGIRVVHPRIAVVLTPAGGALAKMLPPFRAGVGGRIGSGRQGFPWIALDDLIYGIHHLIVGDLSGPVNLVSPCAVSNAEFTRTLASVLKRPAFLPMPAFAVKTLFGQMGEEALLCGAHVVPTKLLENGFQFSYSSLEPALRHLLGRTAEPPAGFTAA